MCSVTPESLSSKAADFSVCKQKYLLVKNNGNIICFVEGKYDVDYYLGHFRHHFGEYFELLECKNKKNVLKAYDTFYSSDHSNVKMGFFGDRCIFNRELLLFCRSGKKNFEICLENTGRKRD